MKTRLKVFCTLLFTITFLTSCQKGLRVSFVNNAATNAIVIAQWSQGKSEAIEIGQGEIAGFDWPLSLSIRHGSNEWRYASFPRVDRSRLEPKQLAHHLNVQIQSDGTLHVRPNGVSGIVTNFSAQPPGFPLKPSVNGSSINTKSPGGHLAQS